MGKLLGLLLVVIAIATVYMFVGRQWLPEDVSEHGPLMDAQFNRTMVVVGVAFFLAQVALGYAVIRYGRRGNDRAVYTHGSNKLEAIWTIVTAIIFIAMAVLGQRVWMQMHLMDAPPDSVKVQVLSQQFQWNFHYPGPDGTFGKTDPKLIDDSALNYIGLDKEGDPAAKDDAQITTLAVPVNRPVELSLRSKDVIHSFFVPVMRFKQDTVPGINIKMHFTATKVGKYEVVCAELCGQLHYNMKTFVLVLPAEEYDQLTALPEEGFKGRLTELLNQY